MSKAAGERSVTIGDRTLKLRFSIMALAELEERWDAKGIHEVMKRASNPGARDLVDIFFAVTRSHHSEDLSHSECMALLDKAGFAGITTNLMGAIEDAADEMTGGDEPAGKPQPAT